MQLTDSLQSLLDVVQNSEWDQIERLTKDLLPVLEATRFSILRPSDSKQVEQVLTMLDSAIECCSERKEQIAPLVKALTPLTNTSYTE